MSDRTQQQPNQQKAGSKKPALGIDLASAQAAAPSFSPTSASPPGAQASSPQHERDAARAIRRTDSWKPAVLARRLSYDMEDRKRQAQMRAVAGLGEEPGFSERCT